MMNMANMQEKLVKQGWLKKPPGVEAPVVHTRIDTSVPELGLKLDLGGKVFESNYKAALDIITATKQAFQPSKSRGIVSKTNIQDSLLKVGWFKQPDEASVHGPRSHGTVRPVSEGIAIFDLWLKSHHELFDDILSETSETKSAAGDDVAEILNWTRKKEKKVSPGKRQYGMVQKAAFRKNLLSKGWYSATGNSIVKAHTPAYESTEGPAQIKTDIDIGPHDADIPRPGDYDELGFRNSKTIPKVKPSQSNYNKTRVEKWVENSNKILLEDQRKHKRLRRNKSEIKYKDKRSKKAKPHEKAINSLLQQGWIKVNRTRNQVTLVKLPERELLSKSAGIEMQTKNVSSENGDVQTNNPSNNTTSIRRFLLRSRKMLRRMFTCGRNEE